MDIEDEKELMQHLALECIDLVEEETSDIDNDIKRFMFLAHTGANLMETGLYMIWTHLNMDEKQRDKHVDKIGKHLATAVRETLAANIRNYKNQSKH